MSESLAGSDVLCNRMASGRKRRHAAEADEATPPGAVPGRYPKAKAEATAKRPTDPAWLRNKVLCKSLSNRRRRYAIVALKGSDHKDVLGSLRFTAGAEVDVAASLALSYISYLLARRRSTCRV